MADKATEPRAGLSEAGNLTKVVIDALRFADRMAGDGVFYDDGNEKIDPSGFLFEAYADCNDPLTELQGRVAAAMTQTKRADILCDAIEFSFEAGLEWLRDWNEGEELAMAELDVWRAGRAVLRSEGEA